MDNVIVRRPNIEDKEELCKLFYIVIQDTFRKNNLEYLVEMIEEEIESKIKYLEQDFESDGKERYFLIAEIDSKIIGTIEYGASSELIERCTDGEIKDMIELGTIFVLPEYQGNGIGNLLINKIANELNKNGIDEICLDSGYKTAQKTWTKKFGKAQYQLKDYWLKDNDHMIWKVNISEEVELINLDLEENI